MKIIVVFISLCGYQLVSASKEDGDLFPSSLVPFPFLKKLCPAHYYYNKLRKKCMRMPGGGNAVTINCRVNCASNDIRAHPDYQQFYTVCSKGCFLVGKCPNGMIFDKQRKRCTRCCINIEICEGGSDELDSQVLDDYQEASGDYGTTDDSCNESLPSVSVECPKNQKYSNILQKCAHFYRGEHRNDVSYFPKCVAEGSFRSPKHCSLYYLCRRKKCQRGFYQEKFHCLSSKKRYDPDLGKCLPKEQVTCNLPGLKKGKKPSTQIYQTHTNITMNPGQRNVTVSLVTQVNPANVTKHISRSGDTTQQPFFRETLHLIVSTNNSVSTEKTQSTANLKCDQKIRITSTDLAAENSLLIQVMSTSNLLNFQTGKPMITTCNIDIYLPRDHGDMQVSGVCETDLKQTKEKANVNKFIPLNRGEDHVEVFSNSVVSDDHSSLTIVDATIDVFMVKQKRRLPVDRLDSEGETSSAIEVMLLYDLPQKEASDAAIQPRTNMNGQTLVTSVSLESRKLDTRRNIKLTLTMSKRDANTTNVQVGLVATNLSRTTNLSCVIRRILKKRGVGSKEKFQELTTEKVNNTRKQIVHQIVIPIDTLRIDVSDYSVDLLPRLSQDTHMTTKAMEAEKLELYILSLQNIAERRPTKSCLKVTTIFHAPLAPKELVFLPRVRNDRNRLIDAQFSVTAHDTTVISVNLLLNITDSGSSRDVTTNLAVANITQGLNVTCILTKMWCDVEQLTQKSHNESNHAKMTTITNQMLIPMTPVHFELSKIVNIDVHPKFNKLVHVETRSTPGKLKIGIDSMPWQQKESVTTQSSTTKKPVKSTKTKILTSPSSKRTKSSTLMQSNPQSTSTKLQTKTKTTSQKQSSTTRRTKSSTNFQTKTSSSTSFKISQKSSTTKQQSSSQRSSTKSQTTTFKSSTTVQTRSSSTKGKSTNTKSTPTSSTKLVIIYNTKSTTLQSTVLNQSSTTTTLKSSTTVKSKSSTTEGTAHTPSRQTSSSTLKFTMPESTTVKQKTKTKKSSTVKTDTNVQTKISSTPSYTAQTTPKDAWDSEESAEVLDDDIQMTKTSTTLLPSTTTMAPKWHFLETVISYTIPRIRKKNRKIKPKTTVVDHKTDQNLVTDIVFESRRNKSSSVSLTLGLVKHDNVATITTYLTTSNLPSRVNVTCLVKKTMRDQPLKHGAKFEDATVTEIGNSTTMIIYRIWMPIEEDRIKIGNYDIDVLPTRKKPKHKVRQTLEPELLKIDVLSLKGPRKSKKVKSSTQTTVASTKPKTETTKSKSVTKSTTTLEVTTTQLKTESSKATTLKSNKTTTDKTTSKITKMTQKSTKTKSTTKATTKTSSNMISTLSKTDSSKTATSTTLKSKKTTSVNATTTPKSTKTKPTTNVTSTQTKTVKISTPQTASSSTKSNTTPTSKATTLRNTGNPTTTTATTKYTKSNSSKLTLSSTKATTTTKSNETSENKTTSKVSNTSLKTEATKSKTSTRSVSKTTSFQTSKKTNNSTKPTPSGTTMKTSTKITSPNTKSETKTTSFSQTKSSTTTASTVGNSGTVMSSKMTTKESATTSKLSTTTSNTSSTKSKKVTTSNTNSGTTSTTKASTSHTKFSASSTSFTILSSKVTGSSTKTTQISSTTKQTVKDTSTPTQFSTGTGSTKSKNVTKSTTKLTASTSTEKPGDSTVNVSSASTRKVTVLSTKPLKSTTSSKSSMTGTATKLTASSSSVKIQSTTTKRYARTSSLITSTATQKPTASVVSTKKNESSTKTSHASTKTKKTTSSTQSVSVTNTAESEYTNTNTFEPENHVTGETSEKPSDENFTDSAESSEVLDDDYSPTTPLTTTTTTSTSTQKAVTKKKHHHHHHHHHEEDSYEMHSEESAEIESVEDHREPRNVTVPLGRQ